MIAWTLTRVATGETRSFTGWGIRSAVDHRVQLGLGTVELGFLSDLVGSLPFDPNETLLISADGDPWFRGRALSPKRGAVGSAESAILTIADPWWYLENLIFRRYIRVVADPNANPVPSDPSGDLTINDFPTIAKLSSDIVLSESEQGALIGGKLMVLAVLNFAIAAGAPIAIGTIDDGLSAVPREALRDVTCAAVIQQSLRWTPDQQSWWDYSVDPPALNIRSRANRPLLTLDVNDETTTQVALDPRYDLMVPGVTINYLRRHQRTNFEFNTLDLDVAGPSPLAAGAVVVTIELNGSYLFTQPPPADPVVIPQEPAPVGIASAIYNAYKNLSFDGRVSFLASDAATLYLSKTLRILNGDPLWVDATMDIQDSILDLFPLDDASGEYYRVELTVGFPKHLSASDIASRVRTGRTQPPPLVSDADGGKPKMPTWDYGNPDIPASALRPDITLYVYYPNSSVAYDGDAAMLYDSVSSPGAGFRIRGLLTAQGTITLVNGVRVLALPRHTPTDAAMYALMQNSDYEFAGAKPDIVAYRDSFIDPFDHHK